MSTESKTYRLVEMSESIQDSIDNIGKVVEEQSALVEVVKASKDSNRFENFIDGLNTQKTEFGKQIETLTKKKNLLDEIVTECTNNKDLDSYITMLLDALGVFENDVSSN